MKKTAVLVMILTLIALLLIVGCAQTKPGATNEATIASSAGGSAAQLVTPTVSSEKSVTTIESDIAGIDSLDQDLDTSDL
ncbi:hypothetical protein HY772_05225, partial [Candidatus Woesearchaeota archaeon]|nr:hypothetical protein [Candidatus Woesearchaeota archaeon]